MTPFLRPIALAFLLASSASPAVGREGSEGDRAVHAIATIEPGAASDLDLVPIAAAIGDRRIVMLGEATHGDGSTFLAKTRLVEFLVRDHGFDVLIFESGIGDMAIAQSAIAEGHDVSRTLANAVFPVWSHSAQFEPLADFIAARRDGGDAIELAGFDMQMTGDNAAPIATRLRAASACDADNAGRYQRIADAVEAIGARQMGAVAEMDVESLSADADAINAAASCDTAYVARIAKSLSRFIQFVRQLMTGKVDLAVQSRESQMSENLHWLLTERFANRKIIVWAATSHLIGDRSAIEVTVDAGMVPVGAQLRARMGRQDIYTIAFVAGGGEAGSLATRRNTPIPAPAEGSIEAELATLDGEYFFRPIAAEDAGRPIGAMGYAPWKGDWHEAIDAVFYIRRMQPTAYPPPVDRGPQP